MLSGVLLTATVLATAVMPVSAAQDSATAASATTAASAASAHGHVAEAPESALQSGGEVIVEIRFRGNYSIPDETLMEASGVTPGDPIEADTLALIEQRLRDTEGVGEVEVLKRYRSMSNTTDVVLLINIKEHVAVREKFMFLPVFTWTDEYGITFGARFTTVDMLGLDERLSFPLTWGGDRSAAAEIGFDVERAALSRVRGGLGISQRENPHFEVRDRRFGGWIDAMKRWEKFEVGARAEALNIDFGATEENQLETGLRAAVDTRQDAQLPRNAFYIGGAWDHLRLFESDQSFNRLTADLRGYKTFIGRSILAAQAYWRGADGRLPDWERPFLGGAQTVRGYDAGAFVGDNIALLSAELRVPITPPLPVGLVGLNFFFDSGAVYDWGTALRKARFKNGFGGGIYFFAAFVGLQVDVAYGLESEEVHFHFSTGFRF
jgi:outer membrane protein assembly factor BamA